MTTTNAAASEHLDALQRIIEAFLAKRNWTLVEDLIEFTERVDADIRTRGLDPLADSKTVERAVTRRYCVVLYEAACAYASQRQRLAFKELWEHLYRVTLWKLREPDPAQEVCQRAYIKTWEHLNDCRDPQSFLGYARMILVNEINEHFRRQGREMRRTIPLEKTASDTQRDGETELPSGLDQRTAEPEWKQVDRDESEKELLVVLQECLSLPQQRVVIEYFFNNAGFREIAEKMEISIVNVHVLKHRALKTLRECEAFLRFLEERLK